MNFIVKRLSTPDATTRIFHLFDEKERLLLVAELGSPWSSGALEDEVRFSKPDGALLAKLTSSSAKPTNKNGYWHTDYALIVDFAVHAIFNAYHHDGTKGSYYILEVGESRWLALVGENGRVHFFDSVPSDFPIKKGTTQGDNFTDLVLSDAVGTMTQLDETHMQIELPVGRLSYLSLIALAWVAVFDRNQA